MRRSPFPLTGYQAGDMAQRRWSEGQQYAYETMMAEMQATAPDLDALTDWMIERFGEEAAPDPKPN